MAVFGAGADVVFAGSKVGIIDHKVAERLEGLCCGRPERPTSAHCSRLLPCCGKPDVQTPADFVALAGSTLAWWGEGQPL